MKYMLNDLTHFEFHDSDWFLLSHDPAAATLVVNCEHLNLHKDALPEPLAWDMELEIARITFTGVSRVSFEPSRAWKQQADGTLYTDEPQVIHEGETAKEFLLSELRREQGIWVYDVTLSSGDGGESLCRITAGGNDPFLVTAFAFDTVTVEWDDFRCPAWYEREAEGHAP